MEKLEKNNENPLWRNYMDKNVKTDDTKWLKEVKLDLPFPSKSFAVYTEDEFLEKLKTDKEFNEMWGGKQKKAKKSLRVKLVKKVLLNFGLKCNYELPSDCISLLKSELVNTFSFKCDLLDAVFIDNNLSGKIEIEKENSENTILNFDIRGLVK